MTSGTQRRPSRTRTRGPRGTTMPESQAHQTGERGVEEKPHGRTRAHGKGRCRTCGGWHSPSVHRSHAQEGRGLAHKSHGRERSTCKYCGQVHRESRHGGHSIQAKHAALQRRRTEATHAVAANPERTRRGHFRPHPSRGRGHRGPPSRAFQEASINRSLKARGVDPSTVDVHSEVDPSLSLSENRSSIMRRYGHESRYSGASSYELSQEAEAFEESQRSAQHSEYGRSPTHSKHPAHRSPRSSHHSGYRGVRVRR